MKERYIKSPLNYTGGKYKLLKEIIPLFPDKINTFVDLFGGGFNVGINVNAKHIIYNDIECHVVELMKYLANNDTKKLLYEIDSLIQRYNLSKENADGYNQLREYYNEKDNSPIVFYTLICHAFNYQIRFNNNGKYNMPFGKSRSSFNSSLRQKFTIFTEALHNKDVCFTNISFDEFDFSNFDNKDFVYCDQPYFNSVATYNEKNGWTDKHEKKLLLLLDKLNNQGIKFALSNNLKYDNHFLDEWKDKYNVHYLTADYHNCNYHKKNKGKDIEILVTNY